MIYVESKLVMDVVVFDGKSEDKVFKNEGNDVIYVRICYMISCCDFEEWE